MQNNESRLNPEGLQPSNEQMLEMAKARLAELKKGNPEAVKAILQKTKAELKGQGLQKAQEAAAESGLELDDFIMISILLQQMQEQAKQGGSQLSPDAIAEAEEAESRLGASKGKEEQQNQYATKKMVLICIDGRTGKVSVYHLEGAQMEQVQEMLKGANRDAEGFCSFSDPKQGQMFDSLVAGFNPVFEKDEVANPKQFAKNLMSGMDHHKGTLDDNSLLNLCRQTLQAEQAQGKGQEGHGR